MEVLISVLFLLLVFGIGVAGYMLGVMHTKDRYGLWRT